MVHCPSPVASRSGRVEARCPEAGEWAPSPAITRFSLRLNLPFSVGPWLPPYSRWRLSATYHPVFPPSIVVTLINWGRTDSNTKCPLSAVPHWKLTVNKYMHLHKKFQSTSQLHKVLMNACHVYCMYIRPQTYLIELQLAVYIHHSHYCVSIGLPNWNNVQPPSDISNLSNICVFDYAFFLRILITW